MKCIPRDKVDKMKEVFSKLGERQISQIVEMTTKERVTLFSRALDEESAKLFNRNFEEVLASKKLKALSDWVEQNLDKKYRDGDLDGKIAFLSKNFKTLDEVDNFIETRVDVLAEQSIGLGLNNEQVAKFKELGEKFFEASKNIGNDIGRPDKVAENIEWGKTYKALQDYSESLMPRTLWKGLTQKLGKAQMLASIKTPLLNIESNTINGITEAIGRRFGSWQFRSVVDKGVAKDYMKFANKMFKETGIDFTRMISLEDTVTGAGKVTGETASNIGQKHLDAYADFVFNKLLTTPDVAFGSFAFADSLSLYASKMAKGDSRVATELFKNATQLNATGDARVLREMAIADARMATYTNDSVSSQLSEKLRQTLNVLPGLGDLAMPFVKTPANVAELSATYAGVGFIKGIKPAFAVGKQIMKGQEIDRELLRSAMTNFARAGIGMSVAYIMASQFEVSDFMGVYDPKRLKIDQLANSSYNAVKIKTPFGEKWVSTDYLGPLGAPFVAFMYSKKYGGASGYISGATSQFLAQLPFLDAKGVFDFFGGLTNADDSQSTSKAVKGVVTSALNTLSARLIPGIMADLSNAFDAVQRETKQKTYTLQTPFYEFEFDKFVEKIPYFRTRLPEKYDVLGRIMYEESPADSMLFGARVRTPRMDDTVKEIYRLRDSGHTPTIKDLRFMNSSKVDELEKKLGKEKFYEVAKKYGETLAIEYRKEMDTEEYRNFSDEEKKGILDSIGQDEYEMMLINNGVPYN